MTLRQVVCLAVVVVERHEVHALLLLTGSSARPGGRCHWAMAAWLGSTLHSIALLTLCVLRTTLVLLWQLQTPLQRCWRSQVSSGLRT